MIRTGVIEGFDEVRWDIRPSPAFGTIETACTTRRRMRPRSPPSRRSPTSSLSISRACTTPASPFPSCRTGSSPKQVALGPLRHGRSLIVSRNGATESARDGIARLKEELAPVAADLGCAREFADLDMILSIGAAYERQRAVAAAARPGQGLNAVVDLMRAEMAAGRPLALAEFAALSA